jgi:subtilisin-like proprotein convertase family protein
VRNSGDRQINLWFANQMLLGNYKLSINSSVHDLMGVAMKPYQTTLTLQAPNTHTNSTATTIKAKSLTTSTLTLSATSIGSLTVRLNVSYPFDRDLYIYLISPTGKTIALDYNRGGWSANLTNTVFSQQASTPIAAAKAPFAGAYRPEVSLNELIGSKAGGTWRLGIYNSGSHSGKLLNWSLTVTPSISVSSVATGGTTTPSTSTTETKWYTNSTSESIRSKSLTVSSVTVPAGAKVGNVEVRVNVKYPDDRDLYIYLIYLPDFANRQDDRPGLQPRRLVGKSHQHSFFPTGSHSPH